MTPKVTPQPTSALRASRPAPRLVGRGRARTQRTRAARLWLLITRLVAILAMGLAPAPAVAMTLAAAGAPTEYERPVETEREVLEARNHAEPSLTVQHSPSYELPRGYSLRPEPLPEPHAARWLVPPQRKTLLHLLH